MIEEAIARLTAWLSEKRDKLVDVIKITPGKVEFSKRTTSRRLSQAVLEENKDIILQKLSSIKVHFFNRNQLASRLEFLEN